MACLLLFLPLLLHSSDSGPESESISDSADSISDSADSISDSADSISDQGFTSVLNPYQIAGLGNNPGVEITEWVHTQVLNPNSGALEDGKKKNRVHVWAEKEKIKAMCKDHEDNPGSADAKNSMKDTKDELSDLNADLKRTQNHMDCLNEVRKELKKKENELLTVLDKRKNNRAEIRTMVKELESTVNNGMERVR